MKTFASNEGVVLCQFNLPLTLSFLTEQERIERGSKYTSQLVQDISAFSMGDIRFV